MRISIQGQANVFVGDDDDPISDPSVLQKLDGIKYVEERFTDFLGGTALEDALALALEPGGYLHFTYVPVNPYLTVTTEFRAKRRLSKEEIDELVNYTCGQWSDGIGENFVSESTRTYGYTIICETDSVSVAVTEH